MRAFLLTLMILAQPGVASAADISRACYNACEERTTSNPEYKACLARAADAADAALNKAYSALKEAMRRFAKEMGQAPDLQLESLVGAQKRWIPYRDANCTFEDELAFGGTSLGGNYSACLCALSLERADDFARISAHLIPID
jgi:uncharacterized protein YecT (DUF1311 family)